MLAIDFFQRRVRADTATLYVLFQPPELETRIAILRKKATQDRLAVPGDVLEFIAERIERNIREAAVLDRGGQ